MTKTLNFNLILKVIISEIIAIAVILLSVYVAKLFFKDTFSEIKNVYKDRFFTETTTDLVLK